MCRTKFMILVTFLCVTTSIHAEDWQQIDQFSWIDLDSIEVNVKSNRYYYISVKQKQNIQINSKSDPNLPYIVRFLLARISDLNSYKCCITWTSKCDEYIKSYSKKTSTKDGISNLVINKDICLLNKNNQISSIGYVRNFMVYDSKKDTLSTMIKGTMLSSSIYVANKMIATISGQSINDTNSRLNITQGIKECELYVNDSEYRDSCNSFKATNDTFYKYYYPKINFMMRTK